MDTADDIEGLLNAGLKAYGLNETDTAYRLWRRVLELQPENAQARDFLAAAGMEIPAAPSQVAEVVRLDQTRQQRSSEGETRAALRSKVEHLVRERKISEALEVLLQARPRFPDDPSISRSIRILRDRLAVEYGHLLGQLDNVPRLTRSREALLKERATPEELELLKLIDGIASLGDIVRSSHLERVETYRLLLSFRDRGWITTRPPTNKWSPAPVPLPEKSEEPQGASQEPPLPRVQEPTPPPPSRVSVSAEADEFEVLFRKATEAYLLRDYPQALELFTRCAELRPADRRVQHNLQRLQARRSS